LTSVKVKIVVNMSYIKCIIRILLITIVRILLITIDSFFICVLYPLINLANLKDTRLL